MEYMKDDELHEIQRQVIKWGSRGKGDKPLQRTPVGEMETDHIIAVLALGNPAPVIRECMRRELLIRQRG